MWHAGTVGISESEAEIEVINVLETRLLLDWRHTAILRILTGMVIHRQANLNRAKRLKLFT